MEWTSFGVQPFKDSRHIANSVIKFRKGLNRFIENFSAVKTGF